MGPLQTGWSEHIPKSSSNETLLYPKQISLEKLPFIRNKTWPSMVPDLFLSAFRFKAGHFPVTTVDYFRVKLCMSADFQSYVINNADT
jgi:hypothetical protein